MNELLRDKRSSVTNRVFKRKHWRNPFAARSAKRAVYQKRRKGSVRRRDATTQKIYSMFICAFPCRAAAIVTYL